MEETLFEMPTEKPPKPILVLSGYAEPGKKKPAYPDYSQFSLPGFGPKFGEIERKHVNSRKVSKHQLPF